MAISPESKMRSPDRILVLAPIEGMKPLTTDGMVDPSLFTGANKLHAIRGEQDMLWYLKYERGIVPPPFKQKFTSFNTLKKFVDDYYKKRNIKITEVID